MAPTIWAGAVLAIGLAATPAAARAADKPVLSAGTELSTPGEVRPSAPLVQVVMGALDKDDVEQLDVCLAEKKLKRGDYAALLRAVKVEAGAGHTLWFVRPAQKPYCFALYGAHLFRYFWIEEQPSASPHYRLRFQNGGDFFAVYAHRSHGLNDIEATGCIVSECSSARMAFDGREYRTVQCALIFWDDQDRQVKKPRRCRSDGWRDDQSSGFAPRR